MSSLQLDDSERQASQPAEAAVAAPAQPAAAQRGPKRKSDLAARGAGSGASRMGVVSSGSEHASSEHDDDDAHGGRRVYDVEESGGSAIDGAAQMAHLMQQQGGEQPEGEIVVKRMRTEDGAVEPQMQMQQQEQRPLRSVQPGGSQGSQFVPPHTHHVSSPRSRHHRHRRHVRSGSGSSSGTGSGSGSHSGSASSSTSSSGSSSSSSDSDDASQSDPQARAARRDREAHMLTHGQPEADGAAAAAAAAPYAYGEAASVAPSQLEGPLFSCSTTQLDTILQLLLAVRLDKKEQTCRLSIATQGMKVVSELPHSRAVCAKAYLKRDLFHSYALNKPLLHKQLAELQMEARADYSCHLSLSHIIDCMQLLGAGSKDAPQHAEPTVMHFNIQAYNHPLGISLEGDDGAGHRHTTTCELQVLDRATHEGDMFQIGMDKLLACVLTAPQLRHAFSELDIPDAELLTMYAGVSRNAQGEMENTLAMEVVGHGGFTVRVELSRDPLHGVFHDNKLELFKGPFKLSYELKHLRPCIRALAKAEMSNVRINSRGLLSIQHVISSGPSSHWIEFFVSAKEAPESEDAQPLPLPPEMQSHEDGGDAVAAPGAYGDGQGDAAMQQEQRAQHYSQP